MKKIDQEVFRTPVPVQEYGYTITHQESLLCMGSCFAEHIGNRLSGYKFPVSVNPFGILFNPLSIAAALERLWQQKRITISDLYQDGTRWLSFAHHGKFSGTDPDAVVHAANEYYVKGGEHLRNAQCLILTLGTAYVWERRDTGAVVANCHKLPASFFTRRRASVEEIAGVLEKALLPILEAYPRLKILLTVSPVRYVRDGLLENQRSKAILLLAIDMLEQRLEQVRYFPAYELLMDDLRDYRFYATDMAHPSELALEYVWNYFKTCLLDEREISRIAALERLQRAMQHRPIHPDSTEHQQFLERQLLYIESLERQWPALDFSSEKAFFKSNINRAV